MSALGQKRTLKCYGGTFNSRTMIVMIIAITPSLNAARRSLPMTLSLLVQIARHYQGQQLNLATGAEGSRHFKALG